jgi:hypothetical protein
MFFKTKKSRQNMGKDVGTAGGTLASSTEWQLTHAPRLVATARYLH